MGETHKNIRETHIIGSECREHILPLNATEAGPLRRHDVSMAGVSLLRGEYAIARRAPPYHVVLCTSAGAGLLKTSEGREWRLKAGTVALLPAGNDYVYRLDGKTWELAWFHLRASTRTWRTFAGSRCSTLEGAVVSSLLDAMRGARRESSSGGRSLGAAHLYFQLVALLLERFLQPFGMHGENAFGIIAEHRAKLDAVFAEVEETLHQAWTVDRLARLSHMSAGHLHRLCLQLYDENPMQHVTKLRMARAKELLLHSSFTVYEVAEKVGYDNAFSFSTAFRRVVGVSPTEWRKLAGG